MPVTIIDTLQRGGVGTSPFPVIKEDDSRLSYITVVDLAARNAIPEWKRLPFMRVHVIADATDYRLGADTTLGGQVWTEVESSATSGDFQLLAEKNQPSGYVGLEADGKINPLYINNIYANNSYVVATLAGRNALTTATGDIVTVTDLSKIYVKLNNNPPTTTDADFAELLFPGAVLSVNGQTGVVNITIASLLTVPANVTDLNNFISISPAVAALNSVTALHTTQIAALQADVAALQAALAGPALLSDYDSAAAYTLDQAVKFQEASGRYNLYVATGSIAAGEIPGTDPDWLRIGDYYTTAESDLALSNKANLVGGVVPVDESNPISLIMSHVVPNITARNALTPRVVGMRVYVTGAGKAYIYAPGNPGSDFEGFLEEVFISSAPASNIYTVDGTLTSTRTLSGNDVFSLSLTALAGFTVASEGIVLNANTGNFQIIAGGSAGAAGQALVNDGAGNVVWGAAGSTTTADNGLTETGGNIRWGGPLLVDTYIEFLDGNSYFNLNPGDSGDGYFDLYMEDATGTHFSEIFQMWDMITMSVDLASFTVLTDTAVVEAPLFVVTIGSDSGGAGQGLLSDGAGHVVWGTVASTGFLIEYFVGNGVTTVFTIPGTDPIQIAAVYVGGQRLRAGTHYTVNTIARTVTIAPAVAAGIGIDIEYFSSLGDVSSLPQWDESTWGIARISTQAETDTGTDNTKGLTPQKLSTKPKHYDGGAFTSVVNLTVNDRKFKQTITGAIAYTKTGTYTAAMEGNVRKDYLLANGTNKPTFSSDFVIAWDNWVNVVNTLNIIRFEYLSSGKIAVDMRNY